jgi:hypothetical protein
MPLPNLIGINGYKGSGKDTVADYLVREYGYEKRSLAASLKQSVAALFNIPVERIDEMKNDPITQVVIEGYRRMSFREFLQRYGTESHRSVFGDSFWVDQCLPTTPDSFYSDGNPVCISDVRFPNELHRVKSLGGINIRISRPEFEGESHASEQAPEPGMIYTLIQNDKSIDMLENKIDLMLLQWGNISTDENSTV